MKIQTKIQKNWLCAAVLSVSLLAAGCGGSVSAPKAGETPAAEAQSAGNETGSKTDGTEDGAAPVCGYELKDGAPPVCGNELKDGVYPVTVDSSSSMFRITQCQLTVEKGAMSAVMTMSGTGYLRLYMGTGDEASKATEKDYISYEETSDGAHTFTVPVEALDMDINCSAFSRKKEQWYDRVLVFRSESLPADAFAEGKITTPESLNLKDGMYTAEVVLEGGSGRSGVKSPAALRVENGKVFATVIWNSSNYDYMKVDGESFEPLSAEGNSAFEIPVSGFDWRMPVIADTIAMSDPHEIDYTLNFDSSTLIKEHE